MLGFGLGFTNNLLFPTSKPDPCRVTSKLQARQSRDQQHMYNTQPASTPLDPKAPSNQPQSTSHRTAYAAQQVELTLRQVPSAHTEASARPRHQKANDIYESPGVLGEERQEQRVGGKKYVGRDS